MHLKYGFISVDDHVQETPNLWTSRVQKKFADRVPHLVTAKDGSEQWFLDGQVFARRPHCAGRGVDGGS